MSVLSNPSQKSWNRFSKTDVRCLVISQISLHLITLPMVPSRVLLASLSPACWQFSTFTAQHHHVCPALSADGRRSLTHTCQRTCFRPSFPSFLLMQFLSFLFRLDSCSSPSQCYLCRSFQPLLSSMLGDYWCHWTAFYDLYLNICESILLCDAVVNINHFAIYIGDKAFLYIIVQVNLVLTVQPRLVSNPGTFPSFPSCMIRVQIHTTMHSW